MDTGPGAPSSNREKDSAARVPSGGGLVGVAIRQPVFTAMMMVALVVLGGYSLRKLAIDEYPNVSFPVLTIQTLYPGAPPEAVEREITQVIEEAVNTSQGIKDLTSKSLENVSVVVVQFKLGTEINAAAADVRSKIEQVRRQFPAGIDAPVVQQFDARDQPVMSLALTAPNRSTRELTVIAERQLKRELEGVSGVGRVQINGGLKREIHVELQPQRMQALQVGPAEVVRALQQQNLEVPAGRIQEGLRDRLVRVYGRVDSPRDFERVIVAERGGVPVLLSQVARVVDTTEEPSSLALFNGKPAIGIDLLKVAGGNTVELADEASRVMDRVKLPAGVSLSVVRDNSKNIRASVAAVREELMMGAILTVLVVFLFLNDARATTITSLALPVSVISTFVLMHALDFTLNVMTLLALSLSIGLLVDDAIVVIESAVRHRQLGKGAIQAAFDGTAEIFFAVVASTLTVVAVFVPVAFMGGIIGKFFFEFGMTIAWAILVSLFVSFTLTPMLSAYWLRAGHGSAAPARRTFLGKGLALFNRGFDRSARGYRGVIRWVLRHRLITLGIAALSFVGALGLFRFIGGGFMPEIDSSEFSVTFQAPSGYSFEYTRSKAEEINAELKSMPEVDFAYLSVGSGIGGSVTKGDGYVKLVPPDQRKSSQKEIMGVARQRLARLAGIRASVTPAASLGTAQKPIQIPVRGTDLDVLGRVAGEVERAVKAVPGAIEVESSLGEPRPEIRLQVDIDRANDLGLDAAGIAQAVQPLLSGIYATTWEDADRREYQVVVRLPWEERTSLTQLGRLPIMRAGVGSASTGDSSVSLGQVASIVEGAGPNLIERQDLSRVVTVSANTEGRSLSEISADIQARVAGLSLPPGYTVQLGGDTAQLQETVGYVLETILLALILIYLILASQLRSFLQPLSIIFSVPLALVGVFLGLLVCGDTLNMMSMIGLIMLMGIVTKNAILLVDSANEHRAAGTPINDALVEAGEVRLRPIMMTTLATIFGMLPIALGLGAGGEGRAPMARAVIGGLTTSTLLTLLVVPVIYTYLEGFSDWARRAKTKKPAGDQRI